MPLLELPDRTLTLHRFPQRDRDPLQPWDAADEYLLKNLAEAGPDTTAGSPLIVGDSFGALAAALHDRQPVWWNDSHLAELGLAANLADNGLPAGAVTFVPGDEDPEGPFDLVLLKVPKSLVHLEDLLLRLRPLLSPGATVQAGSMIKHTPARVYRLMEKIIGPTKTSLGWKKARLAEAKFDPDRALPPRLPEVTYELPGFGWVLGNGPNLFSRDRLDAGARLLLENLPMTDESGVLADLGCGNGVLALAMGARCTAATVLGVDESYGAIASAASNLKRNGLDDGRIRFAVADGLTGAEPASLDGVVCNPPFHQAQTVGDHLAWRMFEQARTCLKKGGALRVVGNRHLGYHLKLKRLFGNCEVLASDRKFVVFRSEKR